MKTTEEKKENNQTIIDLVACFSPTGVELKQNEEIVNILDSDFFRKYFAKKPVPSKEQIITMIFDLRSDALILSKKEVLFQELTGIATRLFSAKEVDIQEILDHLSSKKKEYSETIMKKNR